MFSVIIADDEFKICELIQESIDWKELGYCVLGCALTGTDALELIKLHNPDVVITDIRMPGLNGNQLIEKAKEVNPNIEFIILSGYRHFEYAHNAMKYNVEHYLFKPIEEEELKKALLKIRQKLSEKMEKVGIQNQITIELSQNRLSLKRNFLTTLLTNPIYFTDTTITQSNRDYHLNFKEGSFLIFIIKVDDTADTPDIQQNIILLKRVLDLVKQKLDEFAYETIIDITQYDLIGIVNFDPNMIKELMALFKEVKRSSLDLLNIFNSCSITFGISTNTFFLSELPGLLDKAILSVYSRIITGQNKIIYYKDISHQINDEFITDVLSKDCLNRFSSFIETNNNDELKKWFLSLKSTADSYSFLTIHEINIMCERIITRFLNTCEETVNERIDRSKIINNLNLSLYRATNIHDIIDILMNTIIQILANIIAKNDSQNQKAISTAKKYILTNFNRSIKLEDVANVVSFNPSYFSVLFKQETGQFFSEYLLEIRLKEAKRLLKETNYNISDLASRVGYNDVKHFTKVFKKSVGITPSKYRKLCI